jgi:uncharacterized radical SAM superfamily Fe-S cluster-containing enzyme
MAFPSSSVEETVSVCSHGLPGSSPCLLPVRAHVREREGNVYLDKSSCTAGHPLSSVLLADDLAYYERVRTFRGQDKGGLGVPFEPEAFRSYLGDTTGQHSCVAVVEITDRCNLTCPTCFAKSSPTSGTHRSVESIVRTLDDIASLPDKPDVVQLSGGEPTYHPAFFTLLEAAKQRFTYTMINTNGVRLAREPDFAASLAPYREDFGVYLQFDSFKPEALHKIRGADLTRVRHDALARLNEHSLSTILVSVLQRGVNTDEIGALIDYALQQRCVRGVTFQPAQYAGRLENFNPATERFCLSTLRQEIARQSTAFPLDSLIPAPCNPDALFMGFALKHQGNVYPISGSVKPRLLLEPGLRGTLAYAAKPEMQGLAASLLNSALLSQAQAGFLSPLTVEQGFQVLGIRFSDPYDFDVRVAKRSCVHIARERSFLPFDVQNIFHR